jgi:hypothetical protein
MSNGAAAGGAAAAAAAAAIAQAIKASGSIVRVEPEEFLKILSRTESPLVVTAEGGFIGVNHQYLTSYKGLAFFTKNKEALHLPSDAELIVSGKIWIPG